MGNGKGKYEIESKNERKNETNNKSSPKETYMSYDLFKDIENGNMESGKLRLLMHRSGLKITEIQNLLNICLEISPNGELSKTQFKTVYSQLKPDVDVKIDEIVDLLYRVFDKDHNGTVSAEEFIIAYGLSTTGTMKTRCELAFSMCDIDNNGYVSEEEIKEIVTCMLKFMRVYKTDEEVLDLFKICMLKIDKNKDGKISKDEFLNELMRNYNLRSLLSPFH